MNTRRHLGQAFVALAAAVAVLGLGSTPASANDAEITAGTLDLYSSDSDLLSSQDLSDETGWVECPGSGNGSTFTLDSTTHSWSFTSDSHVSRFVVGTHVTVVTVFSSSGTSSSGGTSTGTSDIVRTYTPNSSNGCGVQHGSPCTMTMSTIALTATHTMSSAASTSDSSTINGNNGDHGDFGFEVATTGSCGLLASVDDGSAVLTDVVLHATT